VEVYLSGGFGDVGETLTGESEGLWIDVPKIIGVLFARVGRESSGAEADHSNAHRRTIGLQFLQDAPDSGAFGVVERRVPPRRRIGVSWVPWVVVSLENTTLRSSDSIMT